MNSLNKIYPTATSSETDQAIRVLTWLAQWLPAVANNAGFGDMYQQVRNKIGPVAKTRSVCVGHPHGPRISGVPMLVSGRGDEAHGHTRLRAIIKDVVIPMINAGQIEETRYNQLQQRLRGQFADCYQQLEATWRRASG